MCEHDSQHKRENIEVEMIGYKIRTSLVGVKQIKYCINSEKSVNLEKLIESLENKSEKKR